MKEFCKCGHVKKYHIIGTDRPRCCVQWQSRKTGNIIGCECLSYEPEGDKHGK